MICDALDVMRQNDLLMFDAAPVAPRSVAIAAAWPARKLEPHDGEIAADRPSAIGRCLLSLYHLNMRSMALRHRYC
jgi:hypothetical protein